MRFYVHKGADYYSWYFCRVGRPKRVSFLRYCCARLMGKHTTCAKSTMSLKDVHVMAQVRVGAHPTSYQIKSIKAKYDKPTNKEVK